VGRLPGDGLNILISGASGYIGSYLVKKLNGSNYNIGVIVRNTSAGFPANAEIIRADLSTGLHYEPKKTYDAFVHLASANDIDSKNPVTALTDTVLGTLNALEFCVKNKIKKFVYFSTFQVYGVSSGHVNETTNVNSLNHYALTHYFAEKYTELYASSGIDYIILRPTNIYGGILSKSTDRWSLVPSCFCKEAYENQRITLLSSGLQQRDFISLENVSEALIKLLGKFDSAKNQIYNLASGETKTIYDTALLVKKIYECKFARKCDVTVKNNVPEKAEEFIVSTHKLKKLGIETSGINKMETEIEKIFELLSEGNELNSNDKTSR
jgi:UDP-glucose 4-epimerase